ncbi:hypothetical protein BJ170DRAFT_684967 [Xylariales sp. AK1849]|nr:hypothetical protein BJ170DRAFT_684967 [Xylariales sp. AK1849]
MAPPKSKKEPTLYDVLSLTPNSIEGQDAPTQRKAVKQAYRRALLKHHPDKSQQAKAKDAPSDPSAKPSSSSSKEEHYTVDQITHAYTVLSDSRQRREYTRELHTSININSSSSSSSSPANRSGNGSARQPQTTTTTTHTQTFRTGVETVDLDDLAWDAKAQVYYQSCRCGSARGYCFRELDLDEVGEEGELMVQCTGCSLWLRVLFEEAGDDDDDDEDGGNGSTEVQAKNDDRVRSGSMEGKKGGWSWKINFGISLGGGASASVGRGS